MISDYILGFLSCDGSLGKNGSTVSLEIQEQDKQILDWFAEELNSLGFYTARNYRIIKDRRYIRQRCYTKKFYN